MEAIQTTIFKCDHCGKRQFRKSDMSFHEKWCKKNPNNKHSCFEFCKHLVKSEEEYKGDGYIGRRTVFSCELLKTKLHSYIAERRKLPNVNDSVRMPLDCEYFYFQTPGLVEIDWDEPANMPF